MYSAQLHAGTGPSGNSMLRTMEMIVALGLIGLTLLVAIQRSSHLPQPEPFDAKPSRFSEERARVYLNDLLAIGEQRPVGSRANEIDTPNMILREVDKIRKETKAKIEAERQYGSGSFALDFLGGFVSVYNDVQNVLVMLHSPVAPPEEGVLMLSAHFDTPVGTRGASDNTANVANLLEILRAMAFNPPIRSVLFMFTGAEETILQGSHSFARSGHRWVPLIKAFINLEAAGSGGRELMFQATDTRLAKAWARASPYPHGSVLGQDVFQSGIIPSDTDFRMYVAEMNIPGIDMANVDNGHNYHTVLDNVQNVEKGAMQRYGENVLATAQAILADDEFWRDPAAAQGGLLVFFDVLGMFVVVVHPLVLVLSLALSGIIFYNFFYTVFHGVPLDSSELDARKFARRRLAKVLGRALAFPLITAFAAHWVVPLSYYSRPWFVLLLYVTPSVYGVVAAVSSSHIEPEFSEFKKASLTRRELLSFSYAILFWLSLSILLLIRLKGSFYLGFAWSVIPVAVRLSAGLGWTKVFAFGGRNNVARISAEEIRVRRDLLETKRAALAGTIYGSILPLVLTLPLLLVVIRFFVPITGRSGSRVPGDVIVALVCGFCTFLVLLVPSTVLMLSPPHVLVQLRRFLFYLWMASIGLALLFRITLGSGSSSFSAHYPKRIYAIHVDAIADVHLAVPKKESYVWIIDADSSSSDAVIRQMGQRDTYFAFAEIETINCDTATRVYCGTPWYLPLKSEIPITKKIPAGPSTALPDGDSECMLKSTKEEVVDGSTRRIHFCLHANERANIFFKDAENGGPSKWSLDAPLASTKGHLYVLIASGKVPQKGTCFWVEVPRQPKLDVAWACHYMEEKPTPELQKVLNALPEWTTPIFFVARWRDAQF